MSGSLLFISVLHQDVPQSIWGAGTQKTLPLSFSPPCSPSPAVQIKRSHPKNPCWLHRCISHRFFKIDLQQLLHHVGRQIHLENNSAHPDTSFLLQINPILPALISCEDRQISTHLNSPAQDHWLLGWSVSSQDQEGNIPCYQPRLPFPPLQKSFLVLSLPLIPWHILPALVILPRPADEDLSFEQIEFFCKSSFFQGSLPCPYLPIFHHYKQINYSISGTPGKTLSEGLQGDPQKGSPKQLYSCPNMV